MEIMSMIASTLRSVPKMQQQGEKVKIIRIKEILTKMVKKMIAEGKISESFEQWKDNQPKSANDRNGEKLVIGDIVYRINSKTGEK